MLTSKNILRVIKVKRINNDEAFPIIVFCSYKMFWKDRLILKLGKENVHGLIFTEEFDEIKSLIGSKKLQITSDSK
ncbi:hypothetical protein RclHR1_00590028 [Rhizophagus clarus]|uniref:Uncharacterized protein n=1 Tax=Rhizophagus clarus TaxID=94130 RepID=A0A2Z6S7W5_9GLOM|nr:hypothetical protein RclHR1_00590028 [Rhizophagus clarus]